MSSKSFGLSVKVIVQNKNGRCLLLKRSMKSKGNPGKWDLPGGKVDKGENFDEALLREVREETGITISLEHVIGAGESETATHRVAYLFMNGTLIDGTVHLSDEHIDHTWVDMRELLSMDICEQFKPFLQTYIRSGK